MIDPVRLNRNVMANFRALMATAYNFEGAKENRDESPAPEIIGSTAMFTAFVAHALTSNPERPHDVDMEAAREQLALLHKAAEKALEAVADMKRKGRL